MLVSGLGCMLHMVNILKDMTNTQEVKTLVKTEDKKTMMISLPEDWKIY